MPEDTTIPEPAPVEPETTTPNASNPSTTAPNTATTPEVPSADKKVFIQLYPKATQTLEINGKTYVIDNQSKTSNNFAYYMDGDTLVIEGSDLKVAASGDTEINDDVKVMGNRNSVDMKKGADTLEIEGDMNMIYGGEGNDFIKVRGDMNSADMSADNDTIWIAGNNNQAHGQGGDDNFFAMGATNVLYGMDNTDAAYYNSTDAVDGVFKAGAGQELRIENKITDGKPFEDWVHGNEDEDGPPYNDIPKPLDGHEVRAYDNNTYTDKYEKEPIYYTEYRDIAYRELDVLTTQNKETGEGTVTKFDDNGVESSKVVLNPDGSASVNVGGEVTTIAKDEVTYYDENGKVVTNPGSLEATLTKLATGQLSIGDKSGVIVTDTKENNISEPELKKPEVTIPSVSTPEEDYVEDETPFATRTEENGIITTTYELESGKVIVEEDTNNNTGKLVSDDGTSIDFTANGDIIVKRNITGLNLFKYEPDNIEFYNPKTNEVVARPETLAELMNEIAAGNISFKSKSALPKEKEGHTIKQVDDKYYTDTYEKDGVTVTEYKDLQYRTTYAKMSVDNKTGEASYTKMNHSVTAEGNTTYTIDDAGNLSIKNALIEVKMNINEYSLENKYGNVESHMSAETTIFKLMTGEFKIVEYRDPYKYNLSSTEIAEDGTIIKVYKRNDGYAPMTTRYNPSTGEASFSGEYQYIGFNADGSVVKATYDNGGGTMSMIGGPYLAGKLNADEIAYVDVKTGELIKDTSDFSVLLEKLALYEIDIIPKEKDGHKIEYNGSTYTETYQEDGKTITKIKDTSYLGGKINNVLTVDNKTGECHLSIYENYSTGLENVNNEKYSIKTDGTMFYNGEKLGNIKDLKFYTYAHQVDSEFTDWGMPMKISVDVQNLSYKEILYKIMNKELYIGEGDIISKVYKQM